MNRFPLVMLFFTSSIAVTSCVTSEFNQTTFYKEERTNGYCHKVFQPIGPTDLIRPTQSRAGDYISYSGPCDGATAAELARKQRRFEQFRFGRDFMPG
jgi:hypothetical protein